MPLTLSALVCPTSFMRRPAAASTCRASYARRPVTDGTVTDRPRLGFCERRPGVRLRSKRAAQSGAPSNKHSNIQSRKPSVACSHLDQALQSFRLVPAVAEVKLKVDGPRWLRSASVRMPKRALLLHAFRDRILLGNALLAVLPRHRPCLATRPGRAEPLQPADRGDLPEHRNPLAIIGSSSGQLACAANITSGFRAPSGPGAQTVRPCRERRSWRMRYSCTTYLSTAAPDPVRGTATSTSPGPAAGAAGRANLLGIAFRHPRVRRAGQNPQGLPAADLEHPRSPVKQRPRQRDQYPARCPHRPRPRLSWRRRRHRYGQPHRRRPMPAIARTMTTKHDHGNSRRAMVTSL